MVVGLFKEKVGTIEKPLLVIPTEPEKEDIFLVLSADRAIAGCCKEIKNREKKKTFKYFIDRSLVHF